MPESKNEGASALQKSLAVLEALLDSERPLGLADVAQQIDMPRQTVYRIARQLEDSGLIRRELGADQFSVGSRLLDISINGLCLASRSLPVRSVLRDLVDQIGETCNVGVLDRDQVVYIERVECDWPLRLQFGPGSRVSVHATAIGKLMLAHLPSRTRMRILESQTLTRYTDATITEIQELDKQFKKIRKSGYAINDQENLKGMIALAVPIFDQNQRVIAGLAVHTPSARMSLEEVEAHLPKIRVAAGQISDGIRDMLNIDDKE